MDKTTIGYLVFAGVLFLLNLNAFIIMAHDKKLAIKGARRVPEKTLFLATGLFGGIGGTLGMILKRHKTKHWYFALFFPLMTIAQIAILVCGYVFFIA